MTQLAHDARTARLIAAGFRRHGFRRTLVRLGWPDDEDLPRRPLPDAHRVVDLRPRRVLQAVEVEAGRPFSYAQLDPYLELWGELDTWWSPEFNVDIELYVVHASTGAVQWYDLASLEWLTCIRDQVGFKREAGLFIHPAPAVGERPATVMLPAEMAALHDAMGTAPVGFRWAPEAAS